jgi:hypothetical protein
VYVNRIELLVAVGFTICQEVPDDFNDFNGLLHLQIMTRALDDYQAGMG